MGYCTNPMFLLVDNSDSPSVVEKLQQRCDSGCYTLLAVVPSSMKVSYALCLSASLLQHGYILLCFLFLFLCSYVPHVLLFFSCLLFPLHSSPLSQLGLCSPFYSGCFLIEPWDSLSGCVHPGIACLAFQASDWAGKFWGTLSGFVTSHFLLGVPSSVTLVKLIVIGHHCNFAWVDNLIA